MGFTNETVITPNQDDIPAVIDIYVGSRMATIDLLKDQAWTSDTFLVKVTEKDSEFTISFSPERFGEGDHTIVTVNTMTGVIRTSGDRVAEVDDQAPEHLSVHIRNPFGLPLDVEAGLAAILGKNYPGPPPKSSTNKFSHENFPNTDRYRR